MPEREDDPSSQAIPARFGDRTAIGVFVVLLVAVLGYWFRHDRWLAEYDILSYFLPWYGQIGDRLRAFDIPGWMPWLAGGSPLAGDPSGGWWYLPVMLAFPLFPVATAFKAMILVQSLVGGLATYALSRLLGLGPIAALTSTVAFVFGPFLASQLMFGTVAGQVSTWIPVAFLGVECSLRSTRWVGRVAWWGLAALGISQVAVSWPGQGLYDALLLIAAWVAYRAVVWPVDPARSWRDRILDMVTTGPSVLAAGFLLGAAGLLPRLETSSIANIRNGDYSGVIGGSYLATPHSFTTLLRDTFVNDLHHRPVAVGAPVFVLAVLAVLIGRRRHAIPFFAGVMLVAGVLTLDTTPLHRVLFLLPSFEVLHDHSPRRLVWVCFLAPAILAGAGVETLLGWRPPLRSLTVIGVPPVLMIAITVLLDREGYRIGWWPIATTLATTVAVGALVVAQRVRPDDPLPNVARLATTALILLVIGYPALADIGTHAAGNLEERLAPESCLPTSMTRTDPGGAGEFLQQQSAAGPPFRYVYDAGRDPSTRDQSYSFRRCTDEVLAVLGGGRAVRLELQSIQGYNPLHLAAYADYIDAMNGGGQDYHWTDPYPDALISSPLMDMLNVRYVVVARAEGGDASAEAMIAAGKREVFRNDEVVVLENPTAFPRAWIVHDVRQDDGTALAQLASGGLDGHQVAFVEGSLPEVDPLGDSIAAQERVTITEWSADSMTATVEAQAAGLVVFSEIHAPGWVAKVDGERVDVLKVNAALRGVPVPAGAHTVELSYEPQSLRLGLWTSGATGIALAAVAAAAITQWVGSDWRRWIPSR